VNSLDNVRIVLVRTFHPGNIGSAARAMKTMGLNDLCLVNPVDFPSDVALKMAAGAKEVVNNASIVDSLYDAVKDCSVVVASTARPRGYDLPELSPDNCARALNAGAKTGKVAMVFGPERMGLCNDDLQLAKYRVSIPANPEYSSLNLAAAVQILSYEIYKEHRALYSSGITHAEDIPQVVPDNEKKQERKLPTTQDVERFYLHLETTLTDTGFIIKNHPGEIMQKFRMLFGRAQPDVNEMNILRGVLSSIQKAGEGKPKTDKQED